MLSFTFLLITFRILGFIRKTVPRFVLSVSVCREVLKLISLESGAKGASTVLCNRKHGRCYTFAYFLIYRKSFIIDDFLNTLSPIFFQCSNRKI